MRPYAERLDWVHPPLGAEPISLWESLHDGCLRTVQHDSAARTTRFDLDIPHLRIAPSLIVEGVAATRILGSYDEGGGFYGSESWTEFEARFRDPDAHFDIMEASLLQEPDEVALRIGLLLDGSWWFENGVHGKSLHVAGDVASLDELRAQGAAYWSALVAHPEGKP